MTKEKDSNKDITAYINANSKNLNSYTKNSYTLNHVLNRKEVHALKIDNCALEKLAFENIHFRNCIFNAVIFDNVEFDNAIFEDCEFSNCKLIQSNVAELNVINTTFKNSELVMLLFNEAIFIDAEFVRSSILDCTFANSTFVRTTIERGLIAHSTFEYFIKDESGGINFKNCEITHSTYYHTDLENSTFEKVSLSDVSFIDVKLNQNTLASIGVENNYDTCNIDLQTILKNNIDEDKLKLFGIHNFFAKDYITDLVSEIKFQSVFISYSFEDRDFAHIINEQLRRHGVNTFLWERDAPGGKRLKKIMSDNIRKHDRLLFIASQHSLQSEACQYELNEAREKQTKEWKDIYYPIHIDNYLFEVRKEDIPRKFREDFWENIEEVKEFHSKDFTKYRVAGSYDMKEFDEEVKKVIKDLKL